MRIPNRGRGALAGLRNVAVAISGLLVLASFALLTTGNALAQVTSGDTWVYDPNTNTWTDVTSTTRPSGRFRPAMAYDADSDRVVLFGGIESHPPESFSEGPANDETWAFDFNALSPLSSQSGWTQLRPSVAPSPRVGHGLVYDSGRDRVVLYGGRRGETAANDETWAYDVDMNLWTRMNPATRPSGRFGHSMVYVPRLNRTVMFGGIDAAGQSLEEMWAYDFNADTWTEMAPSARPPARGGHAIVYDEASGKLVLFGGNIGGGVFNDDTWAYDIQGGTWVKTNPATKPSPRERHDMAYVSTLDRIVLFGGCVSRCGGVVGDTWLYDVDSDTWNRMDPTSSPSARHGHRMAYDKESDRVVLSGGVGAGGNFTPIIVVAGAVGAAVAVVVAALLLRRRKRRRMAGKEHP